MMENGLVRNKNSAAMLKYNMLGQTAVFDDTAKRYNKRRWPWVSLIL